jgi:hypothetical protein
MYNNILFNNNLKLSCIRSFILIFFREFVPGKSNLNHRIKKNFLSFHTGILSCFWTVTTTMNNEEEKKGWNVVWTKVYEVWMSSARGGNEAINFKFTRKVRKNIFQQQMWNFKILFSHPHQQRYNMLRPFMLSAW